MLNQNFYLLLKIFSEHINLKWVLPIFLCTIIISCNSKPKFGCYQLESNKSVYLFLLQNSTYVQVKNQKIINRGNWLLQNGGMGLRWYKPMNVPSSGKAVEQFCIFTNKRLYDPYPSGENYFFLSNDIVTIQSFEKLDQSDTQ